MNIHICAESRDAWRMQQQLTARWRHRGMLHFDAAVPDMWLAIDYHGKMATDIPTVGVMIDSEEVTCHWCAAPSKAASRGDNRVTVVTHGADPVQIEQRNEAGDVRDAWAMASADRVALFVGSLSEKNRPDRLLRAVRKMDGWHAVFAGDGPMRHRLERMCHRWRCDDGKRLIERVRFLGHVQHPGDCYASADCVVLTGDNLPWSSVLFEAMLAGVPVAGIAGGIVTEIQTRHHKSVVLGGPDSLDRSIEEATETVDVEEVRDIAWTHYTLGAAADRWEAYLLRCASQWQQQTFEPPARLVPQASADERKRVLCVGLDDEQWQQFMDAAPKSDDWTFARRGMVRTSDSRQYDAIVWASSSETGPPNVPVVRHQDLVAGGSVDGERLVKFLEGAIDRNNIIRIV